MTIADATPVPVLEGVLPPEHATGKTGTILAIPPFGDRRRWTFRVDGCRCTNRSGPIATHATLSETERCSSEVLRRHRHGAS